MKLGPTLVLAALSLSLAHCGSDSEDDATRGDGLASDLRFHAETEALPGFSKKLGPLPASGPARVSFDFSSKGGIVVDVAAANREGNLTATAGKLTVDMQLAATGSSKVSTALKKYEGPIPGLRDLHIPIKGQTTFDSFLLDGTSAEVHAQVSETKLPPIPLGGVPGKLLLTILPSTKVSVVFRGSCLRVAGGRATYSGAMTVSGTVVLDGRLKLDLPPPLDEVVDLGELTIPIPATRAQPVFPALNVPDVKDAISGSCEARATTKDAGPDASTQPSEVVTPSTPPPPPPSTSTPEIESFASCTATVGNHRSRAEMAYVASSATMRRITRFRVSVTNAAGSNENDVTVTSRRFEFNSGDILATGKTTTIPVPADAASVAAGTRLRVETHFGIFPLGDAAASCYLEL